MALDCAKVLGGTLRLALAPDGVTAALTLPDVRLAEAVGDDAVDEN